MERVWARGGVRNMDNSGRRLWTAPYIKIREWLHE